MNIIAKLVEVKAIEKISADFTKRIIVVNDCSLYNPQNLPLEVSNERIPLIDGFKEGDMVDVSFNMRAKDWVDRSGKTRTFITLHLWGIKLVSNETESTPAVSESTETAAVVKEQVESAN